MKKVWFGLVLVWCCVSCQPAVRTGQDGGVEVTPEQKGSEQGNSTVVADVTGVTASGSAGSYTFSVKIKSPDTGCQQYADWWEVLDESGKLLYRRVLLHSHVDEQPFERSGGPVPATATQTVWIRAHMNQGGYGGKVYKGSVDGGFQETTLEASFAAVVAKQAPLPENCAF